MAIARGKICADNVTHIKISNKLTRSINYFLINLYLTKLVNNCWFSIAANAFIIRNNNKTNIKTRFISLWLCNVSFIWRIDSFKTRKMYGVRMSDLWCTNIWRQGCYFWISFKTTNDTLTTYTYLLNVRPNT